MEMSTKRNNKKNVCCACEYPQGRKGRKEAEKAKKAEVQTDEIIKD